MALSSLPIRRDPRKTMEAAQALDDARTRQKQLQADAQRAQTRLTQRSKVLKALSEAHERLRTSNGQLQERSRLRTETLLRLREVLGNESGAESELQAVNDKKEQLRGVLAALAEKQSGLEKQAEQLEDRALRDAAVLQTRSERRNEARDLLLMLQEDIRAAHWRYELGRNKLHQAEKKMELRSESKTREHKSMEDLELVVRTERVTLNEVQIIQQNYQEMAQEELRQLTIANEEAKSAQLKLRRLLECNGPTCPEDEEVVKDSQELQARLERLNEEMTNGKYVKRELSLRKKQQHDIVAITQASIEAKNDQLGWLERQHAYLVKELKQKQEAYAKETTAYEEFVAAHMKEMESLTAEIKTADKQLKSTERAVSVREKKVTAVSKKVAHMKQAAEEWNEKLREKQEQMSRLASTRTLVDSEVRTLEEELAQEQLQLETTQEQQTTQQMEEEDILSSCAALEADIKQLGATLSVMKKEIVVAETSVKNRVDEIRDKFLDSFVIGDSAILIELLDKEAQNCGKADTDEFDEFKANINAKEQKLKQQYDTLTANMRAKYRKILEQKEEQYKAVVLKARQAETDRKDQMQQTVTSSSIPEADREGEFRSQSQNSEPSHAEFDPPWLEDNANSKPAVEASSTRQHHPTERVPTTFPTHTHEPQPGLQHKMARTRTTLVDSSISAVPVPTSERAKVLVPILPQQRKESEGGARRPRLRKRTAAQKAGKFTKPARRELYVMTETSSASEPSPVNRARTSVGSTSELGTSAAPPATRMNTAKDPMESPVGCDDAIELAGSAHDEVAVKKMPLKALSGTAATSQAIAKKEVADTRQQRGKHPSKRTTAKVSGHRSRKVKARRLSLASQGSRATDWSTADSFSFA